MEYKFNDKVLALVREQGKTKKSLYQHLGMTANGFEQMLENNSFSATRLAQIAGFFNVDVTHFYDLPARPTPPAESDSYLREVLSRLETSFLVELATKNRQIDGMQRTIDYLTSGGQAVQKSFLEPVTRAEDVPVIKLNSKNLVVQVG